MLSPLEVRDLTHLYCQDKDCKRSNKCPCLSAGLPCIKICSCNNMECTNRVVENLDFSESDEEV